MEPNADGCLLLLRDCCDSEMHCCTFGAAAGRLDTVGLISIAVVFCMRSTLWQKRVIAAALHNAKALRPELGGLYQLYAARIAACRAAPPPEGWDGVYVAKDK